MHKNVNASPALDIWSIGCILYAMLVGHLPFEDSTDKKIIKKILENQPEFNKNLKLSKESVDMIENLLKKDPTERYKISDIK